MPQSMLPLRPFPPERADRLHAPASLAGRGFSLRALVDDDVPWLRDLYASTRAEEMAPLPWPAAAKRAFLDQQFALQHNHYLAMFGDSDFLAIQRRGMPLGRLYLQRPLQHPLQRPAPADADGDDARAVVDTQADPAASAQADAPLPEYLIVDIALFPQARGEGIGSALIAAAQARAAADGRSLRLHVMTTNPDAQRLYERLGFVVVPDGGTPTHRLMRWSAAPPALDRA